MTRHLAILCLALAVVGCAEAGTNINAIVYDGQKIVSIYTGDDSVAPFTPFTNQLIGDEAYVTYGEWVSTNFVSLTNGATFAFPDDLNEYTKAHFINSRCWKKTSYRLAYSCDGKDHRYMSGSEKVWQYKRSDK